MIQKEKVMNIKKIKILSCFTAFFLCFPIHFIYDIFPNPITAIFTPVNESIWEHMKLLFGSLLLTGILEKIMYQHFDIKHHNLFFSTWLGAFLSIPLYLLFYLPLYIKFGESMLLNLTILFLTIGIIELLQSYLLQLPDYHILNSLSPIFIIAIYLGFAYLTYYPPHNLLFFDTLEEKYGISEYLSQTKKERI